MDLEEGLLQEILRLTPVARQCGQVREEWGASAAYNASNAGMDPA